MERIIETEHVNRVFAVSSGEFCALKDINVSIPEGAFAILKGRSGSGKTTLMNIIGALDYPTSGKVRIAGNVRNGQGKHEKKYVWLRFSGSIADSYHECI